VRLRLEDVRQQAPLWSGTIDRRHRRPFRARGEVVREVTAGGAAARREAASTPAPRPRVHELWQKAREAASKFGLTRP